MKDELSRKKLREKIELRNISLGVAEKNKMDIDRRLLIKKKDDSLEDDRNFFLNGNSKKKLKPINFIRINLEEERDGLTSTLMLKKYNSVIRYLFSKYSNSTMLLGKTDLIEDQVSKYKQLSSPDIWKMLKDHDCHYYIHSEEFFEIIKTFNVKYFGSFRKDISLKYDDFCTFLLHFAEFFFLKFPFDKSVFPLGIFLEELLKYFRTARLYKGEKVPAYEFSFGGLYKKEDPQEILDFNSLLNEDPKYELPQVIINLIISILLFCISLEINKKIMEFYFNFKK